VTLSCPGLLSPCERYFLGKSSGVSDGGGSLSVSLPKVVMWIQGREGVSHEDSVFLVRLGVVVQPTSTGRTQANFSGSCVSSSYSSRPTPHPNPNPHTRSLGGGEGGGLQAVVGPPPRAHPSTAIKQGRTATMGTTGVEKRAMCCGS